MKILFDTSVMVASSVTFHPQHNACRVWMEAAIDGRIEMFVSCHSLAEFYRVLTSIKASPQFTTAEVWRLLSEILKTAAVVELTRADYTDCLQRLTIANERGGIVYDSVIVQAGIKAHVDKILTLNDRHFQRVWPNHVDQVINPLTTQAP